MSLSPLFAPKECPLNAYISYRLKIARQLRRLSTGDVAMALGIDRETYEGMEDAQSFITASTMIQCAQVTNTPVNDFLPPPALAQLSLESQYDSGILKQKWEKIFQALEDWDDKMQFLSIDRLRELIAKMSTY